MRASITPNSGMRVLARLLQARNHAIPLIVSGQIVQGGDYHQPSASGHIRKVDGRISSPQGAAAPCAGFRGEYYIDRKGSFS